MGNDPYVLCGDCQHCAPTRYDGDDECGPDCHPGNDCSEKTQARDSEVGRVMAVDDDAQRILARLREAPLLMPYLHYSVSIDALLRVLSGDEDRTRAALALLVQQRDAEYLENCSPDHYRAFAVMTPMPSIAATVDGA